MSREYLDFEVEIRDDGAGGYVVAVVRSPAGEVSAPMSFPFGELELQNHLQALEIALLRSGGRRRRVLTPEEETVKRFGRTLFDMLMIGEVGTLYRLSQREAFHADKGLRVKLRIQPPRLASLPWEFLYDPQSDYTCLSSSTPLVRYPEVAQPPLPLSVKPPLRILGMVASPEGLEELDVPLEKQRVETALKRLQADGLVELSWLPGQTWRELQRALWRETWHIFHFIGHGGFDVLRDEGMLLLADEVGQPAPLLANQLGQLLANHRSLRLALLNACEGARGGNRDVFSSTAATLIRRNLPAVVAMQYEISDRAAIEFVQTFYESVADGLPVDTAVAEARVAVSLAVTNSLEWGTPVLYMRAPNGEIFTVTTTLEPTSPPSGKQEAKEEPPAPVDAPSTQVKASEELKSTVSAPQPGPGQPKTILDGALLRQFYEALLDGYNEFGMRQMVRFGMNEDLNIVAGGDNLGERAFNLIDWAIRQGKERDLIREAHKQNPNNAALQQVYMQVFGRDGTDDSLTLAKPAPEQSTVVPPTTTQRGSSPSPKAMKKSPIEVDWVTIPAGEFLMGSDKSRDKNARDNELRQHRLSLPAYRIARTPVTVAQFETFVKASGYSFDFRQDVSAKSDHPITSVSWHHARKFCEWLSKELGEEVRLPTEAEWEKAARGTDGQIYPWGNELPDETRCNFSMNVGDTTPVGKYVSGASLYGCLDMAGNVWEWTSSKLVSYPYDAKDGREDPDSGASRVLRGGSFIPDRRRVRCAYRDISGPVDRVSSIGFRVLSPGI